MLPYLLYGLYWALIILAVIAIPLALRLGWRRCHGPLGWLSTVFGVVLLGAMFGYPLAQNIKLLLARNDLGRVQIMGLADLTGRHVAVSLRDMGEGFDCDFFAAHPEAAALYLLAPLGNSGRADGPFMMMDKPTDLRTKVLGRVIVTRDNTGVATCRLFAAKPTVIDYVVVQSPRSLADGADRDGRFARLIARQGWPRIRWYLAPVANPRSFLPVLADADILLVDVRFMGQFRFPLRPFLPQDRILDWRDGNRFATDPAVCAALPMECQATRHNWP